MKKIFEIFILGKMARKVAERRGKKKPYRGLDGRAVYIEYLFFISTSIVLILLMHINTFLISKHKEKDYDYYNGN